MTFRVIARRIGDSWDDPESWELAPYNDGKGGEYKNLSKVSAEDVGLKEALDEDFLDLFIEFLGDIPLVAENPDNILMLLDLDDGCPSGLCIPLTPAIALPARGDAKSVRVVHQGDRSAQRNRDAGVKMSTDNQDWAARLTNKADVLALSSDTQPTANAVIWVLEGGNTAWTTRMEARDKELQEAKRRAEEREQQRKLNDKHDSGDFFINPYTFVPLPEKIERSSPRGHSELANDGFSGSFDWVLTLQTPLLLPSDDSDTTTGSILHYPGSSLRGALRSLHESLAGGCMRALEDDYVPVHRETMNALQSGDRLVVVREIDPATDRVVSVEETNSITWVRLNALHGLLPLHSGQTLDIDPAGRNLIQVKSRHEVHDPADVSAGSGWVLHLSDSTSLRDKHNYYVPVGRLTGKRISIDDKTWTRYVNDCAGSADLLNRRAPIASTAQHKPSTTNWPSKQVRHGVGAARQLVGTRRKIDGWLSEGDTVWLTADGRLKMSAIWRRAGSKSIAERLPGASHLACTDPFSVCPTCAVFGSVSTVRTVDNEQAGYATHIHVGWGTSREPAQPDTFTEVSPTNVWIAPLRNPKPSSGGFYLEAPPESKRSADKKETHVPRAHWRAENDPANAPRKIRGRKSYWHGQVADTNRTPRQKARRHHLGNANGQIQAGERYQIPTGTVISSKITFENLDSEQLAWLLAAANPSEFFNDSDKETSQYWIHIGGGKPLGYGSASPQIRNFQVFSASSRYGSSEDSMFDLPSAWKLTRQSADARSLTETHRALKKVLKPDAVHADRIWYPTTLRFNQQGTEDFDKSFEWFSKHSGGRLITYRNGQTGPNGNLVPLPDVLNDDQYLESREDQ